MTDREQWNLAVASVMEEFRGLAPSLRESLADAVRGVRSCKEAIHAVAEGVAAPGICASCGGECCRTGKYHVTVTDLLVYLADGRELFVPRFGQNSCPYLGEEGCLMPPGFRPFNCITFICDRVDGMLEPMEKERLLGLEQELRDRCRTVGDLFGGRLRGALLLTGVTRDSLPTGDTDGNHP